MKLLLTNSGAVLSPEDDDTVHKAVQDIYHLDQAEPPPAFHALSFPSTCSATSPSGPARVYALPSSTTQRTRTYPLHACNASTSKA